MMKPFLELRLGFEDAENYRRRENKDLFNAIFVKNIFLDSLLRPSTFFLIGEKGTGKTAYAVFLTNNQYKNNTAHLNYIRETDYHKFVTMKKEEHLQLSDYSSIWKVIILLLFAKSITPEELDHFPINKGRKLKALLTSVDDYYKNAFSPEIINVLNWLENHKYAVELIAKYLSIGGEGSVSLGGTESRFQVNLLYIQEQFQKALSEVKLKQNHLLFIDGIDVRPGSIAFSDYLDCIKGLANAVWSLNNDFFPTIRDSKGRFRAVLLVRPDIFNSINLQNLTNKIRDNSVYLDWRTTYPNHRNSQLFRLTDKLLSAEQENSPNIGDAWDYYFPWKSKPTSPTRTSDPSFIALLRLSYSRPRDFITILKILQGELLEKRKGESYTFVEANLDNDDFLNKYSEYLMGGIKDQLSFYYDPDDYDIFLKFFSYLNGKAEFDYGEYLAAFKKFEGFLILQTKKQNRPIPEFVESPEPFLQFLYDTNIICFIDELEEEPLFRWCYRERNPSNISPKVELNKRYRIHYGLFKALNVGFLRQKKTR
jgi:hypothetical protein